MPNSSAERATDEFRYYCIDCQGTIRPTDKICPHCGADTSEFIEEDSVGLLTDDPPTPFESLLDAYGDAQFSYGELEDNADDAETHFALIEETRKAVLASHYKLVGALRNILADCENADTKHTFADCDFAVVHAIKYARAALESIEGGRGGALNG
jgi:hypothetical protein